MKRYVLLLGAVALTVLAVSCKKNMETELEPQEEDIIPSPYYDPDTETVRTEFVLNVSTNTGKDTKTTAEFAQVNKNFLGMDAVHILSYNLPYTSDTHGNFFFKPVYHDTQANTTKTVSASRDFSLGTLFGAGTVDEDNASRTVELALPLGTNAVVLYGKALKTYSDDLQGVADAAGDPSDLTTLSFSLKSRLTNESAFDAGAYFFSRMLTYIITAGLIDEGNYWDYEYPISTADKSYHFWWPIPDDATLAELPADPVDGTSKTVGGMEYKYYTGQLTWKQLGVMHTYEYDESDATLSSNVVKTDNNQKMYLSPLGEVLGNAYNELTVIKVDAGLHEIRGGSAAALLRTMQDLYAIIERAADSTPTGWEENVAKLLAQDIEARMLKFFALNTDGSIDFLKDDNGQIDAAALISAVSKATSTQDWNTNKSIVNTYLDKYYFYSANTEGFPMNIGLPAGAAALTCDINPAINGIDLFKFSTDIPAYGMGDVTFPIGNYRYPAELMYFGNSPIRVNTAEKKATDYPSTVDLWNTGAWSGWTDNGSVRSDTRSVAMKYNINYGTALLKSTVTFGASTLKDNNHALHPLEEDQSVPTSYADESKGIFVTGIIVGGQADVVGWDFVRKPSNTNYANAITVDEQGKFVGLTFEGNAFNKMVYDKVTTPIKVTGTTTDPVYTLLWDNYDHTKAANAQSDVYIGVELVNNTDMDFWGEMNLIRKGGTFYLVGKLDLSTAIETARDKNAAAFTDLSRDYYCYPPYDLETGNTINAPRVFMQDYMTKATLKIGVDALKHAYVTVPDLRSSQVSLGVSIDMEWEPGLAFEVDLGALN